MNYEKKYDEALERARKLKENPQSVFNEYSPKEGDTICDYIFPELKESEDERIRKALVDFMTIMWGNQQDDICGVNVEDAIAWLENIPYTIDHEKREGFHLGYKAGLEKQGEKQQKTQIWKHWKDGIAGNGEGKLIYLIKNGNDYHLSSCLGFECDYIELSELDNLMLEKQGEQKPRYSIGDVLCDKSCTTLNKDTQPNFEITDIRNGMYICDKCSFPISQQDEYELVAKRIEQEDIWSEEDKRILDALITSLNNERFAGRLEFLKGIKVSSVIDWLKSLKEDNDSNRKKI